MEGNGQKDEDSRDCCVRGSGAADIVMETVSVAVIAVTHIVA
jgi:hypothetical protein